MKNNKTILSILSSILIGAYLAIQFVPVSYAANVATTDTVITNRQALLTNAVHINSITIVNTSTNNVTFGFFDAPGSTNLHSANAVALQYTNQLYTNYSFSLASITNTYTNIYGFITNDIFTAMQRTTNQIAAGITNYGLVALTSVGSNQTVTINFNALQFCNQGLVVTNLICPVNGIIYNIDYNNLR